MDAFLSALSMLTSMDALLAVVAGTLVGIIIGALPGLGSLLAITMALPLTFVLGQGASIALLLGIYCGSIYGGSLSAILINTPGTPQSAATVLDGFPMARRGDAGLALGWSTTASAFGGILATIILAVASPLLAKIGIRFGPVEYFALGLFALTCIVTVSRDNLVKGLLAGLLGLFVAVVGQDPVTGYLRYDFGVFDLSAGIGLVPFLVGLFALSEVFWRAAEKKEEIGPVIRSAFQLPTLLDLRQRASVLIKSSLIGTWIGTLPGVGAASASMVSYAEAKRSSPNKDKFGTGEPDGLIASEAANNAVSSGAMVPTLSLGVPGDPITAVMLGALVLQGVTPGPRLFLENQSLVLFIFMMLFVANICMFLGGMLMSPLFSRILRLPEPLLMACVVVLVATGTYSINANPFDLLVVLIAGIAGFLLRYNGFPLAPMVIGFVLSPMIEQSLRQGLILNQGNFVAFAASPIAAVLFALTTLFLLWPAIRLIQRRVLQRRKGQPSTNSN
ncbi:tripartite tricarboxylate transporter permease [Alloalcanivorax xenomutans]|uniref:tripartite tricarboxylate transporter permease n=1 Tax=Alloalcanivorax xenomutans TaxID=1094342 RepID=UPI0029346E4C|nr:tripartite tricarboxylate transporter permease [Alloalcanivorax xenomutans]WOD28829.1 tripartite tricarboxylate transporter permease [Alloalcanivorax xenomutans]